MLKVNPLLEARPGGKGEPPPSLGSGTAASQILGTASALAQEQETAGAIKQ